MDFNSLILGYALGTFVVVGLFLSFAYFFGKH